LETEDLSFKFSDSSKEILHGLTLKIEQGKRIAIYGANGSGKTTLIRILSGLLHPTSGLCTSMMTFRKINLKAIPLANRQYHSWGNTF
jgi:ABC-type bacteriocin/lantibiotic exporter with double-glycine peptidase domain